MAFSTDVQIRNWKPTGRQAKPCGDRLGLYVRSDTKGQKAFYWRKGSFYKLGDYPALSFADAKAMAVVCNARSSEGLDATRSLRRFGSQGQSTKPLRCQRGR